MLLIDNYDSFVYNLVQELGELGAEPVVHRNDAIDVAGIRSERPDAIVISPGPGRPEDSGISLAVVEQLSGEIPILGVCLGHQCIGQAFGARDRAGPGHHARQDVEHQPRRTRVSSPASPTLSSPPGTTPSWSIPHRCPQRSRSLRRRPDGAIMGLRHRELAVEGVQFHPESVLTTSGPRLLENFLGLASAVRT